MPVKHIFPVIGGGAGVDPKLEQIEYRRDHFSPPFLMFSVGELAPITLTNLPAAFVPLGGTSDFPSSGTFDTSLFGDVTLAEIRLLVNVRTVGSAGSRLELRWWDAVVPDWFLPHVNAFADLGSIGLKDSGWFPVPAGWAPITFVFLGLFTVGGNGVADPQVGLITVYGR
jgi:hypothetical protein